jgi:thiol-disulfide isomerase/thioredoxin
VSPVPARLTFCALGLLASACVHRGPAVAEEVLRSLPAEAVTGTFRPELLRGRVVLLTFVASWCFPCQAELVTLQGLEERLGPRGFSNVLVGMDLEGRATLGPWAEAFPMPGPLLLADERTLAGRTPVGLVREVPTRFLFGRGGDLKLSYTGVLPYAELERLVRAALDEPP